MKIVLQRVLSANVFINSQIVGSISKGILIYVGLTHTDTKEIVSKMADKIVRFRVFDSEVKGFDKSVLDTKQEILVISQFTLYGDCSEGLKPNFRPAMDYAKAEELYNLFLIELKKTNLNIQAGIFGAMMQVQSNNNGPVTLILEKN